MTPRPISSCLAHFRRAALLNGDSGPTDGQLLGEFIALRDETAFEALVKRHAAMVFGVCRRLVGDAHVAEDAFQAVFIVLARRAASIRPREQIGNWLYGVAYRTALKARATLARRHSREKQVVVMPHPEVLPQEIWHDVQIVLDAELAQLPDKLRLPVVLCDLEGRPQREVARQLKLPPATLANRLATARRHLAERLVKRGIVLSGGALAATITANSAHAAVPATLISRAAEVASAIAGGRTASAAVSTCALQLSEGVMRMLFLTKLRTLTACLVASLILACGFGAAALSADDANAAPQSAPTSNPTSSAKPTSGKLNDKEYLRRVCIDLRGSGPTEIEILYFVADGDPHKRSKVVEWLLEDPQALAWRDKRRAKHLTVVTQCTSCHKAAALHGYQFEHGGNDAQWLDGIHRPATRINVNQYLDFDAEWIEGQPRQEVQGDKAQWIVDVLDEKLQLGTELLAELVVDDSDESFLRKACREARGSAPTHLEMEYFKADKDPKKRDKLLDLLIKDPAVAKKLGDGWKQKMLQAEEKNVRLTTKTQFRVSVIDYDRLAAKPTVPERLVQLLDRLLKDKRSDDQVLEALALATLGRLPTESEKKLVIDSVAKQQDKAAAWRDVLKTFAGTNEAKQYADELNRGNKPKQ